MCDLCNDNSVRTYTHAYENRNHRNKLIALFKKRKADGFRIYYY